MVSPNNSGSFDASGPRPTGRGGHFILQKRYEVVSHLGQGGMGTVYMARDLRLANRYCVVKKLRDDFFREEDKQKALEFFTREAMVLSPLKHPNIVSITDYFDEDENYYLVMEYIEGENLHQMLTKRGEPFPEQQVLQWAAQIVDVLNFLHSNEPKVIYRDLKPSNVMIDTKDRVKLVDFGIARPYAEDSDNTHVVSAGYSPPEQYWGAADPRSDIYALGATMYFLLTGQEPLALQVCSPKKLNPNISDRTDQIVQRATQQDVWLRYQTAQEMQAEMEYVPREKNPLKLVQMAAIAIGCLMIVGAGGFFLTKFLAKGASGNAPKDTALADAEKKIESLQATVHKLRDYAKQKEQVAAVPAAITSGGPEDSSAQEQGEAITGEQSTQQALSDAGNAHEVSEKAKSFGAPLKEMDEAQLTDPEGLAPLEEDSQGKRFSLPFLGNAK